MFTITKILKRKDGASVVVAIVIALILVQLLLALTGRLATILSGGDVTAGAGWQEQYLQPVVNTVLQLVLLEIVLWLYTAVVASMKK